MRKWESMRVPWTGRNRCGLKNQMKERLSFSASWILTSLDLGDVPEFGGMLSFLFLETSSGHAGQKAPSPDVFPIKRIIFTWTSLLRICLAMQETQETRVPSLGWEDSLEKEMAPNSSILAWEIPWTEEPGRLHAVCGAAESDTAEHSGTIQYPCSEQQAPHLLTYPLSLRGLPLGSACVSTSTVNCSQLLLCFSLSFLSSRLRTTAQESDSCFSLSGLNPTSPKDAHQAGLTGSRAIHSQGGTDQSDTLSIQCRYLRALFHFLSVKSFKYLVTTLVRSQKTEHLMTPPCPEPPFSHLKNRANNTSLSTW